MDESANPDHHGGDPTRHLTGAELTARLAQAVESPRDRGTVVALVARPSSGERLRLERARLTIDHGLDGDRWSSGQRNPESQVTAMEAGIGVVIANGQALDLFGDNLILDLALDQDNLPIGSRVRVGEATLELTPKPHTGCKKYRARFGLDALTTISNKTVRHRRMRGVHFRVVQGGDVAVGDAVEVVRRGT